MTASSSRSSSKRSPGFTLLELLVALSLEDTRCALPAAGARSVLAGAGELRGGKITLPPHGWAVLDA